jgi:hypothetical protein
MANFAGNAAQDLPIDSDSFGALNVAVGQFAVAAAEGGIGLQSLLRAAGPLARVSVDIAAVNSVLGDYNKRKAEAARVTEEFVDALGGAGNQPMIQARPRRSEYRWVSPGSVT